MLEVKGKSRKKRKPFFQPTEVMTTLKLALRSDLDLPEDQAGAENVLEFFHLAGRDLVRAAHWNQVKNFDKKFELDGNDKQVLEKLTFEKFLKVNDHLKPFREIKYPDGEQRIQSTTSKQTKILLRARALMRFVLDDISEEEWFLACKNSQGTSIGVPYSDTSLERKLTFPISMTARVKPLFERYLSYDSYLREELKNFNSQYPTRDPYHIVEGSEAFTVNKDNTIRRMACKEPTANMFFQQGLMLVMYKRMELVGLDVKSLPVLHRKLARISSLTGRNATIDWSSASDCTLHELLGFLCSTKWFAKIDIVRCSQTFFKDLGYVELNMTSTMGSAVTFPLETLVFWTMAHATILSSKRGNSLFPEWEDLRNVSVFGDDCILPSENALDFIEAMTQVGFIINKEKSFYEAEPFRESCGGDYLAGYDVRPFSIKTPLAKSKSALGPWLYIIGNQLIPRYIKYFGKLAYVYEKEFLKQYFGLFAKHGLKIKLVPSYYPDDSGLKISFDLERLAANYPLEIEDIHVSTHGSVIFRFCRFQYREQEREHGGLRFAQWLKAADESQLLDEEKEKLLLKTKRTPRPSPLANTIDKIVSDALKAQEVGGELDWYKTRRIGGYVEGKGISCHWHVPTLFPVGDGKSVDPQ